MIGLFEWGKIKDASHKLFNFFMDGLVREVNMGRGLILVDIDDRDGI